MTLPELASAEVLFSTFGPGELERITGFPQHLQRLWRSRGHLQPKVPNKRAHFTGEDVAELFVRYLLSVYGVPPVKSRPIGERAGPMVLWAAFLNVDGACEVIGPAAKVANFLNAFANDDRLAATLAALRTDYSRYLWSADGRDFDFGNESGNIIASEASHAYVFLDLEAIAATVGQQARKPLVTVKLPALADQRQVRRLTSGINARRP